MLSLKNQDTLRILTYLSRRNLTKQELFQLLGGESQDSKLVIEQLLKEEIIQLNSEEVYCLTGKGLKSARHLFEKTPHLRGKMKSKSTKRRGFIQLAILQLLKEEPRHGYQVMKLLEEKSDGLYLPSAGTIYPALQDLHDKDLISVHEQADKKVYSLTSNGLAFLSEMIHDGDDLFWEQWRFRLMWRQSKEATIVRDEMEKYHLEFLYAMRSIMDDPSLAEEVASIVKNGREQLISWSEQQERKRNK